MDNVLKEKLQPIKLLICDVDGVLTDGKLIYMTNGEEAKNFSVLDGVGFHMLNRLDLDIKTAWITGRECATTAHRANKLKIDKVYNGVIEKIESYNDLKKNLGNIGESKLLLITAIQMVDDYFALNKKVDSKKSEFCLLYTSDAADE